MGKRLSKSKLPKKMQSDFINVLKGPNKDAMRAYHDRVATVSGPKHKVNLAGGDYSAPANEFTASNTWTDPSHKDSGKRHKDIIESIYISWATDRLQGTDQFWQCATLLEHGDWCFYLYRCGDKYIIRETKLGVSKISIVYNGRARAMSAFDNSHIHWSKYQVSRDGKTVLALGAED